MFLYFIENIDEECVDTVQTYFASSKSNSTKLPRIIADELLSDSNRVNLQRKNPFIISLKPLL